MSLITFKKRSQTMLTRTSLWAVTSGLKLGNYPVLITELTYARGIPTLRLDTKSKAKTSTQRVVKLRARTHTI
jgi:hypothetical protein